MGWLKSIIAALAATFGVTTDTSISQADYDAMQTRAETAETQLADAQKQVGIALQRATTAEAVTDAQVITIEAQNKKIAAVVAAVDGV
ncbi:MAG: hypothetical protein ACK5JF_02870 [Oscillospiraceae bacterium]